MSCLIQNQRNSTNSCFLKIRVSPNSKQNKILGLHGQAELKIAIAAAPEGGKANVELKNFLAETFQVRPSDVEIVSGETSKSKKILLPLSLDRAHNRLCELSII